jgi:hypothetical protein
LAVAFPAQRGNLLRGGRLCVLKRTCVAVEIKFLRAALLIHSDNRLFLHVASSL